MYGEEHYLSKIERNANVVDRAPRNIKNECLTNIRWARDLSQRLENLDYQEREQAIQKIHEILDEDYKRMGFSLEQHNTMKF